MLDTTKNMDSTALLGVDDCKDQMLETTKDMDQMALLEVSERKDKWTMLEEPVRMDKWTMLEEQVLMDHMLAVELSRVMPLAPPPPVWMPEAEVHTNHMLTVEWS